MSNNFNPPLITINFGSKDQRQKQEDEFMQNEDIMEKKIVANNKKSSNYNNKKILQQSRNAREHRSSRTIKKPKKKRVLKFQEKVQNKDDHTNIEQKFNQEGGEMLQTSIPQVQEYEMDWRVYNDYFQPVKRLHKRKLSRMKFNIEDLEEFAKKLQNNQKQQGKTQDQIIRKNLLNLPFNNYLSQQQQESELLSGSNSIVNAIIEYDQKGLLHEEENKGYILAQFYLKQEKVGGGNIGESNQLQNSIDFEQLKKQKQVQLQNLFNNEIKYQKIKNEKINISKKELNSQQLVLKEYYEIKDKESLDDIQSLNSFIITSQVKGIGNNQLIDDVSQCLLILTQQRVSLIKQIYSSFDDLLVKVNKNDYLNKERLALIREGEKQCYLRKSIQAFYWNRMKRSFKNSFHSKEPLKGTFKEELSLKDQDQSEFVFENEQDYSNNDLNESKFGCMACFYSDLDQTNPIVFCEECDQGVHQRCYGIEDLEQEFICVKCQDKQQDQKNRLSIEKENKIRAIQKTNKYYQSVSTSSSSSLLNSSSQLMDKLEKGGGGGSWMNSRQRAIDIYYEELCCLICNKRGGGVMKKFEQKKPFNQQNSHYHMSSNQSSLTTQLEQNQEQYYHMFCAFFVGYYKNIFQVSEFRFLKQFQTREGKDQCYICKEKVGICIKCSDCKILNNKKGEEDQFRENEQGVDRNLEGKVAHPLCAWLEGCQFEMKDTSRAENLKYYLRPLNQRKKKKSFLHSQLFLPCLDNDYECGESFNIEQIERRKNTSFMRSDEDYNKAEEEEENGEKYMSKFQLKQYEESNEYKDVDDENGDEEEEEDEDEDNNDKEENKFKSDYRFNDEDNLKDALGRVFNEQSSSSSYFNEEKEFEEEGEALSEDKENMRMKEEQNQENRDGNNSRCWNSLLSAQCQKQKKMNYFSTFGMQIKFYCQDCRKASKFLGEVRRSKYFAFKDEKKNKQRLHEEEDQEEQKINKIKTRRKKKQYQGKEICDEEMIEEAEKSGRLKMQDTDDTFVTKVKEIQSTNKNTTGD